MTKYIDITRTIAAGMKKYPSDPTVKICRFKSLRKGDSCNLNELTLGSHTGTHIDAPHHILEGKNTVDNIRIRDLICKVAVTNIKELSKRSFLKKLNRKKVKGVLFKRYGKKTGITTTEAKMLLKNKIKLVGIEGMSIEELPDKVHPVHRMLLGKNTIIVENLDLKKVKPGYYKLVCLPLKVKRGDGAPARAVLVYG